MSFSVSPTQTSIIKFSFLTLVLFSSLLISACGGGGSESTPAVITAPIAPPTPLAAPPQPPSQQTPEQTPQEIVAAMGIGINMGNTLDAPDEGDWALAAEEYYTVNEFGAAMYDFQAPQNVCNEDDRLAYIKAHVELQKEFGIASAVWDDGGSFQIYDRQSDSYSNALQSLIFE